MKAYIEPYTPQMRDEVLNLQLREADKQEVRASHDMSTEEALRHSLDSSTSTWVIYYDNRIIAAFGVSKLKNTALAMPWLLGTEDLHKIKFRIIKYSMLIIEYLMFQDETVNCLVNFVSTKHTEAIKWLRWLGFTISDKEMYLHDDGVSFKQFYKWREGGN